MKLSKYILLLLLAMTAVALSSCGGGGGGGNDEDEIAGDSDLGDNPDVIVARESFGADGNLWKPSGDEHGSSPGAVVVIISPKYSEEFDSCEVKLRDGTIKQLTCINNVPWTHRPYSCFANPSHGGDRQHWRSFTSCHDMAEVKATCYLGGQKYIFEAPAGLGAAVCTRFG